MALVMGLSWFPVAWADLNEGLVAYYPFNGNANDESGNGNDGTVNGATLTEDRLGNAENAYSFDGIDDYIFVNGSDSLNSTEQITISAWINSNSDLFQGIVWKETPGPDYGMVTTGNVDGFSVSLDGTTWTSIESQTHSLNEWYLLTSTYDGAKISIFVDGQLSNFSSASGIIQLDINVPLGIGVWLRGGEPLYHFSGLIDDIRIYNRALSECEVKSLYTGKNKCNPNLVELANFTATPIQNDIRLDWKTTSERDTAGFFVWRGTPLTDGTCTNDSSNYREIMQMSFDNARGDLSKGATYSRTDSSVMSGTTYCYLLEDVEFDGDSEFHWNFIDSATAK